MRLFAFLSEFVCFFKYVYVYFCMRVHAFSCVRMKFTPFIIIFTCVYACVYVRFSCDCVRFDMRLCTFLHVFICILPFLIHLYIRLCPFLHAYNLDGGFVHFHVRITCAIYSACNIAHICVCIL